MAASYSPDRRTSMGSAAVASLFPFLLFFFGHYFSLSFVVVDFLRLDGRDGYYYYPVGGGSIWVSGYEGGDFIAAQVMAVALLSYLLLCLSSLATLSASTSAAVDLQSGRRLPLLESFSKARALWRQPSSAARLYFTFLLLGYLLSLLAVLVATLLAVGDALSLGTWRLLVSLLALLAFLYVGILRSVGLPQGGPMPAAADEGGHNYIEAAAKAPWSTALALVEEGKLEGFFLFFFSLVAVHGVLLLSRSFLGAEVYFYVRSSQLYSSVILSLLMSTVWVLGTCRLFRYFGVLLQVC